MSEWHRTMPQVASEIFCSGIQTKEYLEVLKKANKIDAVKGEKGFIYSLFSNAAQDPKKKTKSLSRR